MGDGKRAKVMSIRLGEDEHGRVHAYAVSKGLKDGPAARELIVQALAADGLALYSTELGAYLRSVMAPLIDGFDQRLGERNAEQEDRIARVVHRAARGSIAAAIAAVEAEKALFPGLKDVSASDIYSTYEKQARLMQAGYTLAEARERIADGKS